MKEKHLNDSARELLASSTMAAQSGASIVKQLMSYARQQSLVTEPIRVSEWLRSVRGLFQQTVGESITYTEEDSSEESVITIDSAKLTTAIINLLSNAKDAIVSDGIIALTIRKIYLKVSDPSGWGENMIGPYALFEVIDNGAGCPKQWISQVCDPFFTTKQSKSGTGLGLSSVLGFIKQSLGELRIESELGKGTSTRFILPLTHLEPTNIMPEVKADKTNRNKSILVVEDQDAVRKATSFMLKMMGYKVSEANGSEAAIRILEESNPPQIVITDVQMPGIMDGFGLRDWIRANHRNVRVILTSGYIATHDDVGPDFLQKPYTLKTIEKILNHEATE